MNFFMPKAVAVWLIDNTKLTFQQIATVCSLNTLEIQAIADGDTATSIISCNPVITGELTNDEIQKGEKDPTAQLKTLKVASGSKKAQRKAYVPIARRKAKPDAIFWLLKYYPGLSSKQIMKLVGTTASTITTIIDGTHHNMPNINPRDPVLLKLCSKEDLDDAMLKAKVSNDQENTYNEARKI